MKLKEPFLIILILLILFFCIGSVSALENQTDDSGKNEVLGIGESPEILTAGEGTYSDLRNEINSGGNINLNKSYYRYTNGDGQTIQINTSGVINGNGAVIDMAGSSYRAFYVNVSKVTIKNLTIKNANYDGNGGAIYFSQSGTVENCNFTNNTATGDGGAIKFENRGTLTNCNFVDNKATGESSMGGAVDMFYGNVIIVYNKFNSKFIYI